MKAGLHRALRIAFALALVGCEPELQEPLEGLGDLGDPDHVGDAGDAGDLGTDAGSALDPAPVLFGVVSSDYGVTSIALLGPDGEVLDRDFVNSGSASAGLVTALSGDVVLPTRSGDPRVLTILDRFRTDVVTRIDPSSGTVLGQVKTHAPNAPDDEAGYSSNPNDYVYFGEHDAWITRFEPNLNADEDDPDRGIDLLHLDPTDFERGQRISLWHLNGQGERTNPRTGATEAVTLYARPSSMVRLGDRLLVGITRMSLTFDILGAGMVALVDPGAGTVHGLELPGLRNCSGLEPVADDPTRVVVSCLGSYKGVQRDTGGLVMLKLEQDELAIEHVWRGRDDPRAPLTVGGVVSLGGTRVIASADGEEAASDGAGGVRTPATQDALYVVDLATGEQVFVLEAAGRYKLGSGAYNARRRLLLVPDASTDDDGRPSAGVRVFEHTRDGTLEPDRVIELDAHLPPRQVGAL